MSNCVSSIEERQHNLPKVNELHTSTAYDKYITTQHCKKEVIAMCHEQTMLLAACLNHTSAWHPVSLWPAGYIPAGCIQGIVAG